MNTFGFSFLAAALFGVAFGGTLYVARTPGLLALGSGAAECDARSADCRSRLRAQGERAFGRGDVAMGDAAYGKAALAGDVRAAFQLGWHHEEAYRKAMGKKLEAGTAPLEESQPGIGALPRGAEFAALVKRHQEVPAGPARALADRTLAFLWYAQAANAGFGPAMNNLGAMYQFGLMGSRDRLQAQTWYQRAASMQNPVGRLNDRVLALRYGTSCDFDPSLAFAGGLTAPEIDLEEDIVTRTRFRGRVVPSGIRGMFQMQSLAASKPPQEMGLLEVVQLAAIGSSIDASDLKQNWDDAAEVETTDRRRRDCDERRSASWRDTDRAKLARAKSLQDDMDRRAIAASRRRY